MNCFVAPVGCFFPPPSLPSDCAACGFALAEGPRVYVEARNIDCCLSLSSWISDRKYDMKYCCSLVVSSLKMSLVAYSASPLNSFVLHSLVTSWLAGQLPMRLYLHYEALNGFLM